MKLLVFAHTPPPHHGQSYMVQLLMEGLGGDRRKQPNSDLPSSNSHLRSSISELRPPISEIECYHVNCRYSDSLEDIGSFRLGKMGLVLRYSLEAIWCRFRYGIRALYYVPAPGKRGALYRDWVVMLLCRPFFRDIIHHWHAAGMGDWLRREGTWFERWLTHRLLGRPALGIALATASMRDALWLCSRRVEVVPNGIPDPCPDFVTMVLPERRARLRARRLMLPETAPPADGTRSPIPPALPAEGAGVGERRSPLSPSGAPDAATFQVLYLAHCTRDKGLFDTLDGVALADARFRETRSPLRCRLTVAGLFPREDEEAEFRTRIARADLADAVEYVGFVEGERKAALLRDSDCLCFPTFYAAEGLPVNLLEAISFGLPVVTTRWRAIPEIFPPDYPGFVPPHSPEAVATALRAAASEDGAVLRSYFLAQYTIDRHLHELRSVLQSVVADD